MIHIVLPVHNRASVTAAFAQALARQERQDYRLVLVDDGCTDETVARVRECIAPGRLLLLTGDGNLWWAGALQLAYTLLRDEGLADGDAVLLMNDDVSFEPDFLDRGLQVLAERPGSAIQAVGHDPKTGAIDAGAIGDTSTMRFRPAAPGERANCLATRGLLMSAKVFKESGGFRPDRLPHYFSDYEFTLRLARQGVELVCDPRFRMAVRFELTGCLTYRRDGLRAFWAEAFSNRAKYNPVHASWFVLMTSPARAIPMLLARIWLRFTAAALRSTLGERRPAPRSVG